MCVCTCVRGAGKRVAETMCYSYLQEEGVEVRVLTVLAHGRGAGVGEVNDRAPTTQRVRASGPCGACVQHLRATHGPRGRPRGVQLHHEGAAGGAAVRVRLRGPNTVLPGWLRLARARMAVGGLYRVPCRDGASLLAVSVPYSRVRVASSVSCGSTSRTWWMG